VDGPAFHTSLKRAHDAARGMARDGKLAGRSPVSSQANVHADLSFATDTARSIMGEFAKRIGSHRFEMWFATTTATVNDATLTIETALPADIGV
jgi:hypothetical protein